MTELLDRAFKLAASLSPEEQDALAALLLDEIASENRWHESFAKSSDVLSRLAKEALSERLAGKKKPTSRDGD